MAGRGRGRGALARWEASKTVAETEDVDRSQFRDSVPLSENWEDETKTETQDFIRGSALIRVTLVIDVEHFWAQVGSSEELTQFDKYMNALNGWCDQQHRSNNLVTPVMGQLACVKHAVSKLWRRAQVTRVGASTVEVFYLDYGQVESVPLDRICNSTPGDFMARPAMARCITLEGVHPVSEQWTEEANNRFSELVLSNNNVRVQLSDTFKGKLFLRNSSGQEVSIGDLLISEGHAKSSDESADCRVSRSGRNNSFASSALREEDLFNTAKTNSSLPSKATSSSPGQFFGNLRQDARDISLIDVPLPPSLESDKLETFNIKRTEHSPMDAVRTTKPYLASPKEFLSHSRGQENQAIKGDLPRSRNEQPLKYQPPHATKITHARNSETSASANGTQITQQIPSANIFRSQIFPPSSLNDMALSSSLQNSQPPHSNFMFCPKPGRSNIAAQFQSNFANKVELSSSPKQPSSSNLPQQTEFLKTQPLNDNTRDKTLKVELEWKIFKFQRNVKKLLNQMVADSGGNFGPEMEKIIAESRLSQDFPGVSEVFLLLEMLIERVLEKEQFGVTAVKVCILLRDMSVPNLSNQLSKVLRAGQQELMEQCDISDCHRRWRRFSLFLGRLYLEALAEAEHNGLKSAVDAFVANSLHNWLAFDQTEPQAVHGLKASSLKNFLKIIGPTIDQIEGNEISRYFVTIRNLVLSQDLAQDIKSILLDILLLRAASWTSEEDSDEQESGNLSTEDEVVVEEENEDDDNDDDDGAKTPDDDEEWDPYSKVKAMLKHLKLEDLLPKFFENCIRDSLLTADWEELKRTLQEASFPPGVILEIRMYLDKGLMENETKKSSKRAPSKKDSAKVACNTAQTPTDLSEVYKTTSLGHSIEIDKLNTELQLLMTRDKKDSNGASSVTTKRTSPQGEVGGHDGTPYSRGGTRKFVSRAERRRSTETLVEVDLPSVVKGAVPSGAESVVLPFGKPLDPVDFGSSSEAESEKQSQTSISYSAAVKTSPPEVGKSGSGSNAKSNQSKTLSRPPPGFPPLPTHGGDTEMKMTVLGNKAKAKPLAVGASTRRKSPTRADASLNWRSDSGKDRDFQAPRQRNSSPHSGHNLKWRRFDDVMFRNSTSGNSGDNALARNEPGASATESREPVDTPVPVPVQPHRAFGPGGLKACVICGSRDHLRCKDRAKMFMD